MAAAIRTGATTFAVPSQREIVAIRAVDAPIWAVWDAWTTAAAAWWLSGPPGWAMRVCEMDLRPGGGWRRVWSGPAEARIEARGTLREVTQPAWLVWDTEAVRGTGASAEAVPAPERAGCVTTLVLTEQEGVTTMARTLLAASVEDLEAALAAGLAESWSRSYERLDEYLAALPGRSGAGRRSLRR